MSTSQDTHLDLSEAEVRRLRQQLEAEIAWFDGQVGLVEAANGAAAGGGELDRTLAQTYREMIFVRRALLGRLPR